MADMSYRSASCEGTQLSPAAASAAAPTWLVYNGNSEQNAIDCSSQVLKQSKGYACIIAKPDWSMIYLGVAFPKRIANAAPEWCVAQKLEKANEQRRNPTDPIEFCWIALKFLLDVCRFCIFRGISQWSSVNYREASIILTIFF